MFTLEYEGAMKKGGYMLKIEAMHTKRANTGKNLEVPGEPDSVEFYSYLEDFSDNYTSNWQTEDVFGRMDGLSNYINTRRSITLSFKIPAADLEQSKENLHKVSKLIRFLYPGVEQIESVLQDSTPYSPGDGRPQAGRTKPILKKAGVSTFATNIKTAPVLRLRFANMIQDSLTGGGLYGFIEGGISMKPMKDAGYFTPITEIKSVNGSDPQDELNPATSLENQIFPKVIDISFTFKPLHTQVLGLFGANEKGTYTRFSQGSGATFPYGVPEAGFEPLPTKVYIPAIPGINFSDYYPQTLENGTNLTQQPDYVKDQYGNESRPESLGAKLADRTLNIVFGPQTQRSGNY